MVVDRSREGTSTADSLCPLAVWVTGAAEPSIAVVVISGDDEVR